LCKQSRRETFFVGQGAHVLHVEHIPKQLNCITNQNTTIFWEPVSSTTPVYYAGIKARIIATVSPNKERIHEFKKRAKLFFMRCPGELQIRLIGQVYRRQQS